MIPPKVTPIGNMHDLLAAVCPPPAERREPEVHRLKSWPDNFRAVLSGRKRFEIRRDDRAFRSGDVAFLEEFDPFDEHGELSPGARGYTGRRAMFLIGYIERSSCIPRGFCGFEIVSPEEANRVALALSAGVSR
jgi:hypothetical protein